MDLLPHPPRWIDLINQRFGRLVVLGYTGDKDPRGQKRITCHCDCGNICHVAPPSLRNGATTSCGCRRGEVCAARNAAGAKHGEARGRQTTREYAAWRSMLNRCYDPRTKHYKHYGGRGIEVCSEWRESVECFIADVGRRPSPAHSLDRIDNEKGYFPGNVRWATATEQVRNRRGVVRYEMNGEKLTLVEWAERFKISKQLLYQRVTRFGWSLLEALETPCGRDVDERDLYGRWWQIVRRCTDPQHERYKDYGGRGVRVCDRWRESFEAFVEDVGFPPTPEAYSLDRVDNEGHYEPGNVRWATPLQQNRNRRGSKTYALGGVSKSLMEWSQDAGVDYPTVKRRLSVGWSLEEALGTPTDVGRSKRNRVAWGKAVSWRIEGAHNEWNDSINRTALLDQVVAFYRASGFPWNEVAKDIEDDPIRSVRLSTISVVDDIIRVGHAGQKTCLAFHPHRLEAKHRGQMSVVEAFHDEKMLWQALTYQLKRGDPVTPRRVVRALSALVRAPRNFPPALARWIVDEYAPSGGTVLDPCSGYGGRLLGALASEKRVRYIGFDVEERSVFGNQKLAEAVGCAPLVDQRQRDAEEPDWPESDLVIIGPPYYDLENYGAGAEACLARYQTYERWRDGFLRLLVTQALRSAPIVAINVATIVSGGQKRNMVEDVRLLAREAHVERVVTWPLRAFSKSNTGREEKLLVLRR